MTNPHLDKWDRRFLRIAREVATWSKDPSTKCGCVLVKDRRILATGYNGMPAGLSDSLDKYLDRDYKLATIVHAEPNAIFNAAKNGASTQGCTAYITWAPCSQCASALVQSGVSTVVCPNPATAPERWQKNFRIGSDSLVAAGIKILYCNEEDFHADT